MVAPTFAPDVIGGIELIARLTWEVIEQRYERSTLFTYGARSFRQHDRHIHAHTKAQSILTALRHNWDADVVVLWHIAMLRLLPFMRVPRRAKVILAIFGTEVWWPIRPLARIHLMAGRVDKIISISQHTWDEGVRLNPVLKNAPYEVVPLGLGEPIPPPPAPTAPAAFILSRLAKEDDYKGHRELIQAWPLVMEQIPNAQLWVGGDGTLKPELETMVAERNLSAHIHFLGRISDEEKMVRYQQARCFLMPSRGEGFGLVYLEAMRLGRPCLVSTHDAGREVVLPANAGLAEDPDNTPALAAAVCRLMTLDDQWQEWSRSGRAHYARTFTAQHYQERILNALPA